MGEAHTFSQRGIHASLHQGVVCFLVGADIQVVVFGEEGGEGGDVGRYAVIS